MSRFSAWQRLGQVLAIILCLAVLPGCVWTDNSGTRHTVIVGFGVVSVNQSLPTAATVVRRHTLGLALSNETGAGAELGYSSTFSTTVPDDAEDVRIESAARPFKPILVDVQRAKLIETNQIQPTKEMIR